MTSRAQGGLAMCYSISIKMGAYAKTYVFDKESERLEFLEKALKLDPEAEWVMFESDAWGSPYQNAS